MSIPISPKKQHYFSLIICWLVFFSMFFTRSVVPKFNTEKQIKVTTWDAFGYYVYLPSIFIYHDFKKLEWLSAVDKKYEVTGGNGWQAIKETNGNYVFKYLGGVAFLELPFFIVGHLAATIFHYPQDGFSLPYQLTLGYGILVYCLIAFLFLRKILLRYFNDFVVGVALLLLCIATNFMQYAAVDGAMSHAYIFLLYSIVIFTTICWHEQLKIKWAALTGFIVGLATICRPTEAIMCLIPLLWNTTNKEVANKKWQMVLQHKSHVAVAIVFGFIGIMPQLIYWKLSAGSFVYDVGSKWQFFNPWFRVLLGWEKGWFIYTPITIFFIVGLLYLKIFPFKKSVLWFCVLNIWIVISWSDWRYGGSYSTRALVQSYPVFALPFAAFIDHISKTKMKLLFFFLAGFLSMVNLFQLWQYNHNILLCDGMNRTYYRHIFLNSSPTPLDYSLIDNREFIGNEKRNSKEIFTRDFSQQTFQSNQSFFEKEIDLINKKGSWLKIETSLKASNHLWNNFLSAKLTDGKHTKEARIRLFRPMVIDSTTNEYALYLKVPKKFPQAALSLQVISNEPFEGSINSITITQFCKQ